MDNNYKMCENMKPKCAICGGSLHFIHKGTRDDSGVDVYECNVCHTKQLSQIRENDYEHGFMNGKQHLSDEEIHKRIEQCKRDDVRRVEMVSSYCRDKDVLDFGCGFGGFLEGIQGVAKSIVGVDVGMAEREYLMSQGYMVKQDISEYSEQFDVITLFHVFEHLSEPGKWLDTFADHLKEGGCLFLEVPNANDALLSLYECEKFADFTYWSAHLYLYTIKSLSDLIQRNGRFMISLVEQLQRYPLSNHLYWLAKGEPGGHEKWNYLDSVSLDLEYQKALAHINACDTLFFELKKKAM